MAERIVHVDSDVAGPSQDREDQEAIDCAICLQTSIHPVRLPCGHIFCYLCVKGAANQKRRCPMCRAEFSVEFLDNPELVGETEEQTPITDDGYGWFYRGRQNGWWLYDERTSRSIEESYMRRETSCPILVAGNLYEINFELMVQYRQNDPRYIRYVKRDLVTSEKKGVAGLAIIGNETTPRPDVDEDNVDPTMAPTEASDNTVSSTIDTTLAHASTSAPPGGNVSPLPHASTSAPPSGNDSPLAHASTSAPTGGNDAPLEHASTSASPADGIVDQLTDDDVETVRLNSILINNRIREMYNGIVNSVNELSPGLRLVSPLMEYLRMMTINNDTESGPISDTDSVVSNPDFEPPSQ